MAAFTFSPRDRHEEHRVATPLELMFDLAAVIAIAAAAAGLHYGVAAGQLWQALPSFLAAFFMIWWSWMNYSWFASAYDDGSPAFNALTFMTMFGALVIAAGSPAVFAGKPLVLVVVGFIIMRVAMATLWFGAAVGDPGHRKAALTYGFGIIAMQIYWVGMLICVPVGSVAYVIAFIGGIVGELAVPAIAELRHGNTSWHRHHIIERYGLLNIIVLGECFISIVAMLGSKDSGAPPKLHSFIMAATCGVIAFSLWRLYFGREDHLSTDEERHTFLWSYGHFAIFGAGAATGAGMAVVYDVEAGKAAISMQEASFAVAVPVAIYLAMLWVVRDRLHCGRFMIMVLPGMAALILLSPLVFAEALPVIALLTAAAAIIRRWPQHTR